MSELPQDLYNVKLELCTLHLHNVLQHPVNSLQGNSNGYQKWFGHCNDTDPLITFFFKGGRW